MSGIFRCRACCGLSYRSAQQHDKRVDRYRGLLDNNVSVSQLHHLLFDFSRPTTSFLAYQALVAGPLKRPLPARAYLMLHELEQADDANDAGDAML